jgi:hypothetical protein
MLTLLAQSAAEVERARYLSGVRFFWFLVTVVLILTIVLLVKKIFRK